MKTANRTARSIAMLALLVVTLSSGMFARATSAPAAGGPACPALTFVHAVGLACREGGLWKMTMPDGSVHFTHGPDPVPAPSTAYDAYATPRKPSCVKDPSKEFHIEVLYAHAAGTKHRYFSMLTDIRKMVYISNGLLYKEAARFKRTGLFRMKCSGSNVAVGRLTLPTPKSQTSLGSVIRDMREQGYSDPLTDYWIWFDGTMKGAGGTGTLFLDDRLTAQNLNNYGSGYAATWGLGTGRRGWVPMLHEGSHTMGAIQLSAPHSTGGGHCTDGWDLMCYADGGPYAGRFSSRRCARSVDYDCGHDDYYNPIPKKGSYLATHWNVGSPRNRLIAGCMYRTGSLQAGLNGQDPDAVAEDVVPDWSGVSARSYNVSSKCWGRLFAISGTPMQPPQQVWQNQHWANNPFGIGLAAFYARAAPDFNVCFFKGSKSLKCYVAEGEDAGSVPSGTNSVRIGEFRGIPGIYTFSVI